MYICTIIPRLKTKYRVFQKEHNNDLIVEDASVKLIVRYSVGFTNPPRTVVRNELRVFTKWIIKQQTTMSG